jgi:hypothetical protein
MVDNSFILQHFSRVAHVGRKEYELIVIYSNK